MGNGTILKIGIPKWLKWVKSPNFGVFGGQNQIKVESNPKLYESSPEAKELIWNQQVFSITKWQNNDFMINTKILIFYVFW